MIGPTSQRQRDTLARARACFIRACELDVAVRKPGNVSRASAGHGMDAEMFVASAHAAAGPLFQRAARVGERIEAAVDATWAVAGCNTNLGIVLLVAPIARAVERLSDASQPQTLRGAVEGVLADLDLVDSQAAYRAIARARPGGLGSVPSQDVSAPPTIDLRAAMRLAAHRDTIARQYCDGYAIVFDLGLTALGAGFSLMLRSGSDDAQARTAAAVQRLYLGLLSRVADSHIVRVHGEGVAQTVMNAAQAWVSRQPGSAALDADPEFAAWDAALKAARINPGTTADLTVAALLVAGLSGAP